MAMRSRSSANIRSAPKPRVPTIERERAAKYISAMTDRKERTTSMARGLRQPGVGHPEDQEAQGQRVDDEQAAAGEEEPAADDDGEEQRARHVHRPHVGGRADEDHRA